MWPQATRRRLHCEATARSIACRASALVPTRTAIKVDLISVMGDFIHTIGKAVEAPPAAVSEAASAWHLSRPMPHTCKLVDPDFAVKLTLAVSLCPRKT